MTLEELDVVLRWWGRLYGEAPPAEWEEDRTLTGTHPLARAMEFAPGRKADTTGYLGRARMRGGVVGGAPAWAREPMPCKETRVVAGRALGGGRPIPVEVQQVESAALALHRVDQVRGLVLRAEYCKRGPQAEKAEWVTAQGFPVGLRVYREALAFAKGWMQGRLAA